MSKLKMIGAVLALAVSLPAALAAAQGGGGGGGVAPSADTWGSISYSPSTRAYGYSYRQSSSAAAEQAAGANCAQNATDCRRAITFQNRCGVLAMGRGGGAGWAARLTAAEAQTAALSLCSANSTECKVVRAQCSDSANGTSVAGVSATAPAPAATGAQWGAIYYSQADRKSGTAYRYSDQAGAEAAALRQCSTKSASCKRAVAFTNGCGSIAVSLNGGWGSGRGSARPTAEAEALKLCRTNSKADCLVLNTLCSNGS